jgi:mitotic spindle assembly checkpoint protein MAD2B
MDPAYIRASADFENFLLAYVHTILYHRSIYPSSIFVKSRIYNASVYQSRISVLCSWIMKATTAVHKELSKGTVASIAIPLYHGIVGEDENAIVVERHMLDVGSLSIFSGQGEMQDIERQQRDPLSPESIISVDDWTSFETASSVLPWLDKTELLDEDTRPDLGEQLRAVFLRLEQQCAQLPKLSEPRSFMISMELKDDAKDSPWQDPLIMVGPSSTGKAGKKTVPICSVRDRWLCFDVRVETYENLSMEKELS